MQYAVRMAIGVVRFNFTTSADHTLDSVKQLILSRLRGSTIDIASNTISVQLDTGIPSELRPPPLPGFNEIRGSIRRRS